MRRTVPPSALGALLAVVATLLATGCGASTPSSPDPSDPTSSSTAGPPAVDPAGTSPSASPAAVASCVDAAFDRLPEERRWAQRVVVGVPAAGVSDAARDALRAGPGGIILTDGDTVSRPAVTATVRAARDTAVTGDGPGLLVSTDQEGGQVQELQGPGFTRIPAASDQGLDPSRAASAGWGRELHAAGVNVDLAPVADVVDPGLGRANAVDGRYGRQFGTDVATASRGVTAFAGGLLDAGVAPTLKHFPGLGKVRENTDFAGGVVDATTSATDPDLASFRAGLAVGAPLVMMSSARYTRIDPDDQALFSSTIMRDVLRGRLGFTGVIMTDDVGAAAALASTPVGARATRFLAAGGDLVLTVRPGDLAPMTQAIAVAAHEPGFRARAEDAVHRVLALKQRQGLLSCPR